MRGCPFHNAAVEAAEAMPEIQDIVHKHKRDYIKGLIKLARQAGAANPTLLGNQLAPPLRRCSRVVDLARRPRSVDTRT